MSDYDQLISEECSRLECSPRELAFRVMKFTANHPDSILEHSDYEWLRLFRESNIRATIRENARMKKKLVIVEGWADFFRSTAAIWTVVIAASLAIAWFGMPLWGLLYFLYWLF